MGISIACGPEVDKPNLGRIGELKAKAKIIIIIIIIIIRRQKR